LVLNWPTTSFDQPSERLLRLVADVRIEKGPAIASLLSGKKYVDGNGASSVD
jgi:hypothetical protein